MAMQIDPRDALNGLEGAVFHRRHERLLSSRYRQAVGYQLPSRHCLFENIMLKLGYQGYLPSGSGDVDTTAWGHCYNHPERWPGGAGGQQTAAVTARCVTSRAMRWLLLQLAMTKRVQTDAIQKYQDHARQ